MQGSSALLLLQLLCLAAVALLPSRVNAATWTVNVSVSAPSTLLNVNQDPYDIQPGCSSVGVCVPYNVTINATTLWYWCGWSTKYRTDYSIYSPKNVSVQLMRWKELNGCALSNMSGAGACQVIFGSVFVGALPSGTQTYTRVVGLSFVDEMCLVIANNKASAAKVALQVYQYNDEPRYYGTIFTVIYTILILGGVTTYIAWTCYKEIVSPPDRLLELRSFEESLRDNSDTTAADYKVEPERDATDPGSFQGRVKNALNKAKNLVLRNKGAAQA